MSRQELIDEFQRVGGRVCGAVVYVDCKGDICVRDGKYGLSPWAENTIVEQGIRPDPDWLRGLSNMSAFVANDGTVIMPHELMDEPVQTQPPAKNTEHTKAKVERLEDLRHDWIGLIAVAVENGNTKLAQEWTQLVSQLTYSIEGLWDGLEPSE